MATKHQGRRVAVGVVLALAIAGCAPAAPSPAASAASPTAAQTTSPTAPAPSRAVIVDTDLGPDDLAALAVLLRDPGIDVRAITIAGTGLVHCAPGLRNLRELLADFGEPGIPFGCGRDAPGPGAYPFPGEWRAGADAAYGIAFGPAPVPPDQGDATAVIAAAVAASPTPPMIVALGPWTNLQDAFAADATLPGRLAGIHAMGGTLAAKGNVWAEGEELPIAVEFNFGADPAAVAAVFAAEVPITLVPLDATDDVPVTPALVAALQGDHAAAGADLVFEVYARTPNLSGEGQYLWDQTAAVALIDPGVVTWQEATVRATVARPDAGRIAVDPAGRPVRYATAADPAKVEAALLAALRRGGPRLSPFTPVGALVVRWDGTTCESIETPTAVGLQEIRVQNASDAPVGVAIGGPRAPKTWQDIVAYTVNLDPSQPAPDWIVGVASLDAAAGASARAFAEVPAGTFGPFCATGEWPDLKVTPGAPFTIEAP